MVLLLAWTEPPREPDYKSPGTYFYSQKQWEARHTRYMRFGEHIVDGADGTAEAQELLLRPRPRFQSVDDPDYLDWGK